MERENWETENTNTGKKPSHIGLSWDFISMNFSSAFLTRLSSFCSCSLVLFERVMLLSRVLRQGSSLLTHQQKYVCGIEAVSAPVLSFLFFLTVLPQSAPFVHSSKVLSWHFLVFDVEGIVVVHIHIHVPGCGMGVLTVCQGCRRRLGSPAEWRWLWGLDRRRRGLGLPTEAQNSYFVIWNMSEISNEIWSITAAHISQWSAPCVFVCVWVCFWECVVIFILEHSGVRWREKGRGRESVCMCVCWGDFPLELTGLLLSYLKFFFFQFSFVWPLSGRADSRVRPQSERVYAFSLFSLLASHLFHSSVHAFTCLWIIQFAAPNVFKV